MRGEHEQALSAFQRESPIAPSDPLLRRLMEGVVLRQAGEYARSNEAFEWAEREADRRYTRSLTQAAGSLLLNDRTMRYTPSPAEMAMIPYYRMLNHLDMGDMEGALVEARKADALLADLDRDAQAHCQEGALVQYLAGLVHGAGGERNDALVSFRQAEQSFQSCGADAAEQVPPMLGADLFRAAGSLGITELADSVARRYALPADAVDRNAGDLVVLVEHGFVAHLAEQALHLPIFAEEVEGLESGDSEGVAGAAAQITTRLLHNAWEQAAWGKSIDDVPAVQWGNALDGVYILRLAWPVSRWEASRPAAVRVWVDSVPVATVPSADLSTAVARELEERRPLLLTRMVARGVSKYLVSREMEETAEEKGGELLAFVVGRIANLAANELEDADTRSWSLLPDRISVARARVAPGEYSVRIETLSANGSVMRVHHLGRVTVRPGERLFLSQRVWGAETGRPDAPMPPEVTARD